MAWAAVAQERSGIRVTVRRFGSSPHPSPGAYKRRIAKPSALSLSLPSLLLSPPVCRAHCSTSLLCTSLSACCCSCTRGWCATDVLLDQCVAHISMSPGKVIKQEIMQRPLVLTCSPSFWLTNLHRVFVCVCGTCRSLNEDHRRYNGISLLCLLL